jgi:hypothetical protein
VLLSKENAAELEEMPKWQQLQTRADERLGDLFDLAFGEAMGL